MLLLAPPSGFSKRWDCRGRSCPACLPFLSLLAPRLPVPTAITRLWPTLPDAALPVAGCWCRCRRCGPTLTGCSCCCGRPALTTGRVSDNLWQCSSQLRLRRCHGVAGGSLSHVVAGSRSKCSSFLVGCLPAAAQPAHTRPRCSLLFHTALAAAHLACLLAAVPAVVT